MYRKRPTAGELEAATEESKRFRSALDESAEELLCPITMALPVDPVTAEDGMIYERAAVREWIRKGNGKSPSTNELMGPRLLPAPRVRSMIERMVKSGAISGDKADAWQQQLKDQKELQELREKAEGGDKNAMHRMAQLYRSGAPGLPKDIQGVSQVRPHGADLHGEERQARRSRESCPMGTGPGPLGPVTTPPMVSRPVTVTGVLCVCCVCVLCPCSVLSLACYAMFCCAVFCLCAWLVGLCAWLVVAAASVGVRVGLFICCT